MMLFVFLSGWLYQGFDLMGNLWSFRNMYGGFSSRVLLLVPLQGSLKDSSSYFRVCGCLGVESRV